MATLVLFSVGIIMGIATLFVLGKRLSMTLGGTAVPGIISGYEKVERNGKRCTYNYRVKFTYEDQEYDVETMDGFSMNVSQEPNKNFGQQVTVCFSPQNPNMVAIKEFKTAVYMGIIMLVVTIILFLFALYISGIL